MQNKNKNKTHNSYHSWLAFPGSNRAFTTCSFVEMFIQTLAGSQITFPAQSHACCKFPHFPSQPVFRSHQSFLSFDECFAYWLEHCQKQFPKLHFLVPIGRLARAIELGNPNLSFLTKKQYLLRYLVSLISFQHWRWSFFLRPFSGESKLCLCGMFLRTWKVLLGIKQEVEGPSLHSGSPAGWSPLPL